MHGAAWEVLEKWNCLEVVSEREFYTKYGQHLNSRGKESMASRIARTIESMIKKKVDAISMKLYNDTVTDRNVNTKPHRKRQGLMTLQLML
jgi:hypothetical protein